MAVVSMVLASPKLGADVTTAGGDRRGVLRWFGSLQGKADGGVWAGVELVRAELPADCDGRYNKCVSLLLALSPTAPAPALAAAVPAFPPHTSVFPILNFPILNFPILKFSPY